MRRVFLLVAVAMLMTLFAGVAQAQPNPNENSPIGGLGSHTHYVITGNGGCVPIDSVRFERDDRGLHQGAHESGPAHGPWHGLCPAA